MEFCGTENLHAKQKLYYIHNIDIFSYFLANRVPLMITDLARRITVLGQLFSTLLSR